MAITIGQASKIVNCVANDPACISEINNWHRIIPSGFGISGGKRNFAMLVTLQYPSEEKVANLFCYGIANITTKGHQSNDKINW